MGQPQGKGPLGRGCGRGFGPFRKHVPVQCAHPFSPSVLAGVSEREGGLPPKSPRQGRGGNTSKTPALSQPCPKGFAALICRISPPLWHVVPPPPRPRQPPRWETDHLAIAVHELGPQIHIEGSSTGSKPFTDEDTRAHGAGGRDTGRPCSLHDPAAPLFLLPEMESFPPPPLSQWPATPSPTSPMTP